MMLAPWSTAQRDGFGDLVIRVGGRLRRSRSRCSGSSPAERPRSRPSPPAVPRPAAREATMVPWSRSSASPTGRSPLAAPWPEKSVPPLTAPARSGTVPSTPVSMTAIVMPLPWVVDHALRMPYWASQYSPERMLSVCTAVGTLDPVNSRMDAAAAATAATTAPVRRRLRALTTPPTRSRRTRRRSATRSLARARGRRSDSLPAPAARECATRACRHFTLVGIPPAEIPSSSATNSIPFRSARYDSCAARDSPRRHLRPAARPARA